MKLSTFALVLASSAAIEAHTIFTTLWVDGVSAGDGVGIRMRKDPKIASYPISLSDDAVACGYDGETGNPRVVSVNDGATLSFEWRAWGSDPSKGAIDPGHKGPCGVYLKKVESAINDTGVGGGWFKIWDEGYDEDEGVWCNQKLGGQDSDGVYRHKLSVKLPSGLEPGPYLARPELLALHNAVSNPPDPQFYTGCAQIFLNSNGNKHPQDTVSIPGYVKSSDESVTFNIYKEPMALPYLTPGPPVAALIGGAASGSSGNRLTQHEGLEPANAIMAMAGWFGYEVPSYSNEADCYSSGEDCWNQHKECWAYADTLPTGGDPWCTIWEAKCTEIDDNCDAKNWNGPPNKGKDLTPKLSTMSSIPMVAGTSNYESTGTANAKVQDATSSPASSAAAPTTTLLTLASSLVQPVSSSAPSTEAEPSPSTATSSTTAAPVVKTSYETEIVTQLVYVTVAAPGKHRRRERRVAQHA